MRDRTSNDDDEADMKLYLKWNMIILYSMAVHSYKQDHVIRLLGWSYKANKGINYLYLFFAIMNTRASATCATMGVPDAVSY